MNCWHAILSSPNQNCIFQKEFNMRIGYLVERFWLDYISCNQTPLQHLSSVLPWRSKCYSCAENAWVQKSLIHLQSLNLHGKPNALFAFMQEIQKLLIVGSLQDILQQWKIDIFLMHWAGWLQLSEEWKDAFFYARNKLKPFSSERKMENLQFCCSWRLQQENDELHHTSEVEMFKTNALLQIAALSVLNVKYLPG